MSNSELFFESARLKMSKLELFTKYLGISLDGFSNSSKTNKSFGFASRFLVCCLMYITLFRFILSAILDLPPLKRFHYFGDIGGIVGGARIANFTTITLIGWFSHTSLILTLYLFDKPFIHKFEKIWYKSSGLLSALPFTNMDDYIVTFHRREKVLYASITLCTIFNVIASLLAAIEPTITYWDQIYVIPYFFWIISLSIALGISCIVTFTAMAQFVIQCKLIHFNFRLVYLNVKLLYSKIGILPSDELVKCLCKITKYHYCAIEMVFVTNVFWKKYLFCFYMTLVPSLCFLLYQTSHAGLSVTFYVVIVAWTIVVGCMIIFVSAGAALVVSEAHRPYQRLYGLTLMEPSTRFRDEASLLLARLNGPVIG